MERCLLDLLQREKDCVTRINRSENRVAALKIEIERLKDAFKSCEWRDHDIEKIQKQIVHAENVAVLAKSRLADTRSEMRDYLLEVFK